jgi:hypothetical protein
MLLPFDEAAKRVETISDIVMQHIDDFAFVRCKLQRMREMLQRIFVPLLVGGNLSKRQITMSGLFGIFGNLNKAFEQITGRFNVVDASVEANDEKHPAKVILAGRTILHPIEQKLFGIQGFFQWCERSRFLIRGIHIGELLKQGEDQYGIVS